MFDAFGIQIEILLSVKRCSLECMFLFVLRAQETFLQWDQCRRLYNFVLADKMKKLILSHR